MPITSIDPNALRKSDSTGKKVSVSSVGFSDVLNAAAPAAVTSVGVATNSYRSSAVTSAAVTGVVGATSAASNTPYYSPYAGSSTTPSYSSGGYNYGNSSGGYNYSNASFGGGYASGGSSGGYIPGVSGVPGSSPSQDYLEKQALFQQMNDANWEMLLAQVTVNEISRDYQARSNILKTKSDTEINAVRNMRA